VVTCLKGGGTDGGQLPAWELAVTSPLVFSGEAASGGKAGMCCWEGIETETETMCVVQT
jgi:hypothetical protein